jgi:hypothetical protein
VPHAVISLQRAQRAYLPGHHLRQIPAHAGIKMLAHQGNKFRDGNGYPRVATCPERTREVVFIHKRPAVIPEPCHRVAEITRVQQKLVSRFVDQVASFEHNACHAQEQAGHKQRVVPQLPGVGLLLHHMLKTALFGSGQVAQQGIRPVIDRCQQILALMMPGHQRQGDHRCRSVDLHLRQTFADLGFIPFEDRLLQGSVVLEIGKAPETV